MMYDLGSISYRHLSCNKMLLFSCAFFVTLALGIHLMPYFPSISVSLSPSEVFSASTSLYRDSCLFFLHNIMYRDSRECEHVPYNSYGTGCKKPWEWIKSGRVAECGFHKLKKSDALDLLNGSWVVVAGDSQARLMALSLSLIAEPKGVGRIIQVLTKRHTTYHSIMVEEIGMKLDFIWAPFVVNLTEFVVRLSTNKNLPDFMVMGAGLWDMLYSNDISEYGAKLQVLRDTTLALLPVSLSPDASVGEVKESKSSKLLPLFWIGMPNLITKMLNSEEKRQNMTSFMYVSYDNELGSSKLLRQSGGPFLKLDLHLLSGLCGTQCTNDGMHYDISVYDAATQIMLNALIIESNQKLQ